jgi:hypothetical protein
MRKVLLFISVLFLAIANVYTQTESFLIYKQKSEVVNGRFISPRDPELLFYVNLVNNSIVSYVIEKDDLTPFKIEITPENFLSFLEALNKFLEWESLAVVNITEKFDREIPVNVLSKNVIWEKYLTWTTKDTYEMKDEELIIKFNFKWQPSYAEFTRGQLDMASNIVVSNDMKSVFKFEKTGINRDEIRLLINNLTDEKIKVAIQRGRTEEQERNRQRQLQDELFR